MELMNPVAPMVLTIHNVSWNLATTLLTYIRLKMVHVLMLR